MVKSVNQVLENKKKVLKKNKSFEIVEENSLENVDKLKVLEDIPTQVFHPYRLMILSALAKWHALDFKSLNNDIKINSTGTLISHLRLLEDLELIVAEKEFDNKTPKTFYRLTDYGYGILKKLANLLKESFNDLE